MPNATSNHVIVCGFDATGRWAARELQVSEIPYVVVGDEADSEMASVLGIPLVCGDPSQPAVLTEAGIERARSLVACQPSDAENLAIVQAARELRSDLPLVAAVADDAEPRLRRAGAESVSPPRAAGTELAWRALHPVAGERFDDGDGYRIEELTVDAKSSGAGHSISSLHGGAAVVGVRRSIGSFVPVPAPETVLRPGDVVIALGTPPMLERLHQLLVEPHRYEPPPPAQGLPRTSRRF